MNITRGINWLFKKKKIRTIKPCIRCGKPAKNNRAKYCTDCSDLRDIEHIAKINQRRKR
jgi:ribosomal protein L37E